jgi:drug/metabolite transporter (DMT)-like permease
MAMNTDLPAMRGALLALLAAILFGASTPLVKLFGAGVGPWLTAGLLYSGAAIAALTFRTAHTLEAPLRRRQWPRLLVVALFGAMLAPFLFAFGLQATSAFSASLILTFEAVFTALLALMFYREPIDRRVGLALLAITVGGAFLVIERSQSGTTQLLGLLAVVCATLAWAFDNTFSRPLAEVDPGQVVLGKALIGTGGSVAIALTLGEPWPSAMAMSGLLGVGAIGYGLSLRFYLLALRSFGAARTGSVFATAPFVGAIVAYLLGEATLGGWLVAGIAMIVIGVALHITERHEHAHTHAPIDHEHAHTHDDGHHTHHHDGAVPPGAHSHWHQHGPVTHTHPHTPDAHHTHAHR